jgi:hypothetical protein
VLRRVVTGAAAVALLCAACSGGGSGNAAPAASTAPASTAPPTTTRARASAVTATPAAAPSDACPGFHGAVGSRSSAGPAVPGLLTDATAGENGCLDEVQFTFTSQGDGKLTDAGLAPGYTVGYAASGQFMDGDQQVSIDGNAWLDVAIKPAASVDNSDPAHPQPTYLGNELLRFGAHHHLMIVRELPDTNGGIHWVIGLDSKRPFVVDAARDPTTITVYIG